MILLIPLIAFFSYGEVLDHFFTAGDTFALIDAGRVQSFRDIVNIFIEPLMGETPFLDRGRFYRPVVLLSFALDYSIWKLNPYGYHLTNLIVHIIVSILVYCLVRLLTAGNQAIAWLSAVIFTIHPIVLNNVTNIELRQDSIATLFLILSLLLFLKHLKAVAYKRCFLLVSIFFYVLAFWSKEIAIILPIIIFSYLAIFSEEGFLTARMAQAIKKAAPFFIATFILFAWRIYILRDAVGGYGLNPHPDNIIILNYFNFLLNPTNFLRLITPATEIFVFPLISLFLSLKYYKRIISGEKSIRTIKILLMIALVLSSISIFIYPLVEQLIEPLIESAYYGKGFQPLMRIMEGRNTTPLEHYIGKVKAFYLNLFYSLLFFSIICLIGIIKYEKGKHLPPVSYKEKLMTFLFIWLLLPLSIYLFTLTFTYWYMYTSVIPFSIILSVIFIEGLQSIRGTPLSSLTIAITKPVIAALLIISLFLHSPLIRTYRNWQDNAKTTSMLMNKLLEIVPKLPNDTTIFIYNLPANVADMPGYSVKSWLNLSYPTKNVKNVILEKVPPVKTIPDYLDFEIQICQNNNTKIKVILR
jgi:hypothetical protein